MRANKKFKISDWAWESTDLHLHKTSRDQFLAPSNSTHSNKQRFSEKAIKLTVPATGVLQEHYFQHYSKSRCLRVPILNTSWLVLFQQKRMCILCHYFAWLKNIEDSWHSWKADEVVRSQTAWVWSILGSVDELLSTLWVSWLSYYKKGCSEPKAWKKFLKVVNEPC